MKWVIKCEKYNPVKLANLVYFCITHTNIDTNIEKKKEKVSIFQIDISNFLLNKSEMGFGISYGQNG